MNYEASLFNALLNFLNIPEEERVTTTINDFRKMAESVDSDRLLRAKLKQLVTVRDEALLRLRCAERAGAPAETKGKQTQTQELDDGTPVRAMLEQALSLLEGAGDSTGDFSSSLDKAILALKRAKDMVTMQELSDHLLTTSNGMAEATSSFQSNIGEIAFAMMDYQRKIRELEGEIETQKERALKDALTGVLNRGAFDQYFQEIYAHARRFGTELGLFLVDLDYFKRINDTYGHQAGDDVLVNFAKLLVRAAPQGSLVFRFGGDEFAIIFPNITKAVARDAIEDLKHYVEDHAYVYEDKSFSLSISGGLAMLREGEERGAFFKRADKLLYTAKDQGRRQLCVDD